MNNSAKARPKKSEKSPKTKPPSIESTAKGSASDSSHGNNSPVSKYLSTPAQSPSQKSDSLGGSTGSTVSVSVTHQAAAPSPGLLSPSAVKPSPTLWFTTEIQQMMYGFGDCRKPLAESASLVEEIVNQQMTSLLYNAEEVCRIRNGRFIGIEDFLFMLRKDKVKLRRLMRYLTLKDIKQNAMKSSSSADTNDDDMGEGGQGPDKQPMTKRQKICHDFLSTIDETGELTSLLDDEGLDEIKHQRILRAELMSRQMDSQQYLEYCEARQASFSPRYKVQKFKDWLMAGVSLDIKPNPLAMEVLSYMAYETVAQIVDLSLLVKHDQQATPDDPLTSMTPAVCINRDSPPSATTESQSGATTTSSTAPGAGMKSPPGTNRPGSPVGSPPATPTTPGTGAPPPGSLPQPQGSASNTALKNKHKKKKKSGSSSSRDVFTCQAITPADIREALRRYSQCVGPFADFSKCPLMTPMDRLLCC